MDTCFLNRACAEHVRSMLFGPVASQPFPSCPLCTLCARAVSSRALFTRALHSRSSRLLSAPSPQARLFNGVFSYHISMPSFHTCSSFTPSLLAVSSRCLLTPSPCPVSSRHLVTSPCMPSLHVVSLFTLSAQALMCQLCPNAPSSRGLKVCASCRITPPGYAVSPRPPPCCLSSFHFGLLPFCPFSTPSLHARLLCALSHLPFF